MSNVKKISASYDDAADVLYVVIRARIKNARNHEEVDGLLLRYEAGTNLPAGATLLDFKEHWLPMQTVLAKRLSKFFGVKQAAVTEALRAAR